MIQLADNVECEGVTLTRYEPSIGGTVRIRFPETNFGSMTGSVLPTASAVKAIRRTGLYGKQNQSLLYVPWTTQAQADPDVINRFSDSARSGMDNALENFRVTLAGANAAGVTCYPVVYSHRSASGGHHWAFITRYDTQSQYGALAKRGRRDRICFPFESNPTGDRVASISSGLFYGDPAVFVNDHRNWHGLRSECPCWAGAETDPAVFSVPGFDVSAWNGANQVSAVFETQHNPCDESFNWSWPPTVFSLAGYDPTFNLCECFGPSLGIGACHIPVGNLAQKGNEFVVFRREWRQSEEPIAMVLCKFNADDGGEVWINGELMIGSDFTMQPAFQYGGPVVFDVTPWIVPGELNCVGIRSWFGGPNDAGNRIGHCGFGTKPEFYPDFRHGWMAFELRTWHALVA